MLISLLPSSLAYIIVLLELLLTFWSWDFVSFLILKNCESMWFWITPMVYGAPFPDVKGWRVSRSLVQSPMGCEYFTYQKSPINSSANGTFSSCWFNTCSACVNFFFFWLCFGSRGEGWEEGVVGRELKLVIFTSWAMDPSQLCYPLGLWMCV